MVDRIGNFIGGTYREVAKGFMSVLKESKFYEEGVLNPEEFIKAGDYLTSKCPTWKWCSNKSNIKPVEYLPKEKQFLQTINVPCVERVKSFNTKNTLNEKIVESDWVETELNDEGKKESKKKDCMEVDFFEEKQNQIVVNTNDAYMDGIEAVEESVPNTKKVENEITDDCFIVEVVNENDIIKSRTYDITITYDFYYRVPRMWLIGYSEKGGPLSDDEVKEDIMLEYIDKTVTIEKHPCLGVKSVSIHPCRHSMLIKKMISNFEKAGKKLEVERSIVLFLKFLSSVVPTIKYDFTMDIDF